MSLSAESQAGLTNRLSTHEMDGTLNYWLPDVQLSKSGSIDLFDAETPFDSVEPDT
jgi:hypothetical protein